MTRLTPDAYLDHLRRESARFLDVLSQCPPEARVPSCPDWDAGDLLWHLATVHHFWGHVVSHRPAPPDDYEEPERPGTHSEVLEFFRASHAALVAALEAADPEEPAWSWSGAPDAQRVGFTHRRQAHEALIHRLDAEQAAGCATPLPDDLAVDGVDEVLDVVFGNLPPWGRFDPIDLYVDYRITDAGRSVWGRLGTFAGVAPDGTDHSGETDQHVVDDPGRPADVVVAGTAADLDGWLWHRTDGSGVTVTGDPDAVAQVRRVLDQPLD